MAADTLSLRERIAQRLWAMREDWSHDYTRTIADAILPVVEQALTEERESERIISGMDERILRASFAEALAEERTLREQLTVALSHMRAKLDALEGTDGR